MTLHAVKREYLEQIKANDCKYFVLKAEDLLDSIDTWQEFYALQALLGKYNEYRQQKRGKGINKYFVANRDDFPKFESGDEYFNALKQLHNDYVRQI